jgi:hypothetical protein
MAEKGTSAPSYRLSQGTQTRVAKAGLGGEARKHLQKAAIAGEVGKIATGIKDQAIEKQEDTATREEAWDTGFDAMGDRGSWASGELFDQFQTMEAGYRDEYLEAVRTGDTKLQKRLLKDQGDRSSSLQGWKGTMETALKIHKEYGWGEVIKGDTPKAKRKRDILLAMSKMDSSTKVKMGSDGEMVFNIPGVGDVTRREVDEMIAGGVAPVHREEGFMKSSIEAAELGSKGALYDEKSRHYTNLHEIKKELRGSPDAKVSIMDDVWTGETSLRDDLIAAITAPDGTGINFSVKLPKGGIEGFADTGGKVVDGVDQGDGILEASELNETNLKILIKAIQDDPDLLAEVVADWRTQKEMKIYDDEKKKHTGSEFSSAVAKMPADVIKRKTDKNDPNYDQKFDEQYSAWLAKWGV